MNNKSYDAGDKGEFHWNQPVTIMASITSNAQKNNVLAFIKKLITASYIAKSTFLKKKSNDISLNRLIKITLSYFVCHFS